MESEIVAWMKEKTNLYTWKQLASNLTKVLTNSDDMNALYFYTLMHVSIQSTI